MDSTDKKICGMCGMEIPAKAKKCPYCHQWQNKLSMICFHPLFSILLFIVPYIILVPLIFGSLLYEGKSFDERRDSLQISNAEMKFGEQGGCQESRIPSVSVIGKLKNTGDISWKDVVLEVQIFDKKNKLIDTKQKDQYSFVVPAGSEAAFKLSFPMEFPKDEYDNFKVFIRSAKDLRARF